ncbi:MAG: hypothetical protein WC521_01105 [Bdellovibrionales bacterium]
MLEIQQTTDTNSRKPVTAKKNTDNKLDRINLMVVDGSSKSGELIKSILNQLGFKNVFIAHNGLEGAQLLREVRIDLIFTDWELYVPTKPPSDDEAAPKPEVKSLNGAQFVKGLRFSSTAPNPFVPVIMLLRLASHDNISQARDSGVNEVVIKPFSADDLCRKIMKIIDTPRPFITASTYKGPCRRKVKNALPENGVERRRRDVRLFRLDEHFN